MNAHLTCESVGIRKGQQRKSRKKNVRSDINIQRGAVTSTIEAIYAIKFYLNNTLNINAFSIGSLYLSLVPIFCLLHFINSTIPNSTPPLRPFSISNNNQPHGIIYAKMSANSICTMFHIPSEALTNYRIVSLRRVRVASLHIFASLLRVCCEAQL